MCTVTLPPSSPNFSPLKLREKEKKNISKTKIEKYTKIIRKNSKPTPKSKKNNSKCYVSIKKYTQKKKHLNTEIQGGKK